jgi:hypothetical protein
MFAALSLMERKLPPLKYGRPPYWRAPVTPPSRDCHVPTWNWISPHEVPEGADVLSLDTNGAYLGAAGGVKVAHSHLSHQGGLHVLPEPREVLPGYYRITVPYWAFSGTIVSPLGDSSRLETETDVWVAAPTLVLLLELLEEGTITDVVVLDSWTARITCEFRSWTGRLKSIREELLDGIEATHTDAARAAMVDKYNAFKEGYSAALSMMLTGERCQTHRPDWSHTVYAQHAATMWRKAWRYTGTGHPLVSMGTTDEIAILAADLPEVLSRPKPPFRFDSTGRTIGAMKPKPYIAPEASTTRPLALADDTDGDVL